MTNEDVSVGDVYRLRNPSTHLPPHGYGWKCPVCGFEKGMHESFQEECTRCENCDSRFEPIRCLKVKEVGDPDPYRSEVDVKRTGLGTAVTLHTSGKDARESLVAVSKAYFDCVRSGCEASEAWRKAAKRVGSGGGDDEN